MKKEKDEMETEGPGLPELNTHKSMDRRGK